LEGYLWVLFVPPLWIAVVVAASIWYRRSKEKPIFPSMAADAAFGQRGCSGRSLGGAFSRMGGANNCLLVMVQKNYLIVTPQFPFNLMFLPEIYGLDIEAPIESVTAIRPIKTLVRKALRIEFVSGGPAPIELIVHDEDSLVKAIGWHLVRPGNRPIEAPTGPRKLGGLVFGRVFLAIWAAAALFAACTGFSKDWQYRREGVATVATYANPSQTLDGQVKMGVLTYNVGGSAYRLTSLSSIGLYKVGELEKIYYFPSDPRDARESGYFRFDVLWLGLGLVAAAISLFGGVVARRIW